MKIDKAEKGVIVALASAPMEDPEVDEDELKNTSEYQEFEQIRKLIEPCAISQRFYHRRGTLRLDLRAPFEDVDDLNSILNCAAQHMEEPSVEFERHDGFFRNSYVTRFSIAQDTEPCNTIEECGRQPVMMPRVLTLTVPGRIDTVVEPRSLTGFEVTSRRLDDDTLRIEVRERSDRKQLLVRHFSGGPAQNKRDTLHVEIRSVESNYNINTIISVIGVIFGSGVLIQLSKKLMERLKRNAPADPAEGSDGKSADPA